MKQSPTQDLESSSVTHPGRKRSNNEDCYLSLPEHGLWMVADGMGGHEAGEVASDIVRQTLKQSPQQPLVDSIQAAHKAVLSAASQGVGAEGMGSTAVGLRSSAEHFQIAWVGDSRAYLFSHSSGELELLTRDHSYVQMLLESGAIAEAEAQTHPDRNIITQCLGSQELAAVTVDHIERHWQEDQWALLCSDGLSDELSESEISQILQRCKTPRDASRELVQAALRAGGRDNITVQIIAAPKQSSSLLQKLSHWVPMFSHSRRLDTVIYLVAISLLVALLYWTLN
ncbi:PP2C family protein-serine/threonine phosphatase [Gilvimarinus polysaccharolyticus]|uniref:PP2C family protein-serine/threonine phosphatase n=1 Tax=Gilvimarinus polysaccharolyticus TaxID=863921 RepID=UPI0006732EC7|nr:protein phosphatase 2C domain-containing protein [Gilvimarinus polysaccharolyticus]